MSRDKQIEEMAKLLEKDCGRCFNCDALLKTPSGIACTDYYHAMQLYNAGYRKASEVAELEKKIEDLKILLEMCQKSEEGMRELYNTDINALLEAKRKGEIAIAEEIFAEIESKLTLNKATHCGQKFYYIRLKDDIAELKKKYTEEWK